MSGYTGDFIVNIKGKTVKPGDIVKVNSPTLGYIRVKVISLIDEENVIAIQWKSHIPEIEPMSYNIDCVNIKE